MSKKSNTSKRYTAEFKRDAVALAYSSGKTVTEVAREIGVSPEGLRNWVNQDKADRGQGAGGCTDQRREGRTASSAAGEPGTAADDRGPEKSRGLLREGVDEVAVRYAFIDAERVTETNPGGHSVALLCRVLGVSRSGFYAYLSGRPAAEERARRDDRLVAEIRHIHEVPRRAYGAPRVTAALQRDGHRVNHKRVERLMREHDICGITRRRRRGLTRPDRTAAASPDLVVDIDYLDVDY
ncbi:IS3 family transposase [Streptomyces griseoluteus]|uniref:IS3 family transposase n=1 Tax=Streptomyces griseoluteus TaxID=29306 RepID=UPI00367FAFE6